MTWNIGLPTRTAGKGICTLKICSLLAFSTGVNAALVENLTITNPKATALANAVTADPPGVDSIHYNPAGLARIEGREALLKVALVSFTFGVEFGNYSPRAQEEIDLWGMGEVDSVPNTSSETSDTMMKLPFTDGRTDWPLPVIIVPTGGAAFRPPDSGYTVATAAFAPFAGGYSREDDDPARFMGRELGMTRLTYFSPSVGFDFNDEWSFGVGVHFSYMGLSALTDLRLTLVPLAVLNTAFDQLQTGSDCLNGLFDICGYSLSPFEKAIEMEADAEDMMSITATFGALWHPNSWFTWGFVYETGTEDKLKGTYRFSYSEDWQGLFSTLHSDFGLIADLIGVPQGLAEESGDVTIKLKYPAHFATGVSVQVTPQLKVNLDAKWTDWAVWEGFNMQFDSEFELGALASLIVPQYATDSSLVIPRHYESVWNFAIGVEYQYNDRLALRAGWEPRTSSVPDDKLDVLLPLGKADLFGLGTSFVWDKDMTIDLALAYFISKNDIPAGSSTNANDMNLNTSAWYNPYTGMDIKTKTTAIMFESSFTWQF